MSFAEILKKPYAQADLKKIKPCQNAKMTPRFTDVDKSSYSVKGLTF